MAQALDPCPFCKTLITWDTNDLTASCPTCGTRLPPIVETTLPACTDCGEKLDPRGYLANVVFDAAKGTDRIDPYCHECLYRAVFLTAEGLSRWRPRPTTTPTA